MQKDQPHSAPGGYRTDIDGLRAVAVLAVVAFHIGLPFVPGGYVGVDVFFVISGYLISAIILRDIDRGRFSIVTFYERRVRRIFPAMMAMLLVVTLAAAWYLLPWELMAYGRSLLAALASGSNFLFWHEAGYFDAANSSKPLLHTWSLAVEEQFYILFPPLLLLLKKYLPRHIRSAVFALAAISFGASCVVVMRHTDAAFYFTPLRAWELLLGTIVSQQYIPAPAKSAARNLCSIAGLGMILAAVLFYKPGTIFPGLSAALPCVGTALIIAAGQKGSSSVGRLLSLRPVVFVGLISYSLYLWHWPVIVFQTLEATFVPQRFAGLHVTRPAEFVISLVLAVLSYTFVERPFRFGRVAAGRRNIFVWSAGACALLVVAAGLLIGTGGIPSRWPPKALAAANHLYSTEAGPYTTRMDDCFVDPSETVADLSRYGCLTVRPGLPTVLLAGDSHARSLYPGVVTAFAGSQVLLASASGCSPLLREPPVQAGSMAAETRNCHDVFAYLFEDFLQHHSVDLVVLTSRWIGTDFEVLGETVAWFKERGIPVVVVGPNAQFDGPLPRYIAEGIRKESPDNALSHMEQRPILLDQQLKRLASTEWHVPYVSYFDQLCQPQCQVYAAPDVPLTTDGNHLTAEASVSFGEAIRAQLARDGVYPPQSAPKR